MVKEKEVSRFLELQWVMCSREARVSQARVVDRGNWWEEERKKEEKKGKGGKDEKKKSLNRGAADLGTYDRRSFRPN
jgi:hypothetical protein